MKSLIPIFTASLVSLSSLAQANEMPKAESARVVSCEYLSGSIERFKKLSTIANNSAETAEHYAEKFMQDGEHFIAAGFYGYAAQGYSNTERYEEFLESRVNSFEALGCATFEN